VFLHLEAAQHAAHPQRDRHLAGQRPPGALRRQLDLLEFPFGGREQFAALAGPLLRQQGIATGDEPLARIGRVSDLGQVALIEGVWEILCLGLGRGTELSTR